MRPIKEFFLLGQFPMQAHTLDFKNDLMRESVSWKIACKDAFQKKKKWPREFKASSQYELGILKSLKSPTVR